MAKAKSQKSSSATIGFEQQIWDAACELWGHIPAADYRKIFTGLIFLRYIGAAFEKRFNELVAEGDGFENAPDEYAADNIFFVPEDARWSKIASALKQAFIKEALMLNQSLSLCSSMVKEYMRIEAAFFESVRVLVMRLMYNPGGKKFSLKDINDRINELLKQSIKSDGVLNLFSDVGEEFNLFDTAFLEDVARMKNKNLAVEMLKKLIDDQVKIYKRTNLVKSEKFSELVQQALNRYLNGMLTNEEVIQEMLKLAKEMMHANEEGNKLGLTDEELAFYDALTKPEAVKDFHDDEQLVALTKELTETLRKNRTIDWQKKESARAGMRRLIKHLLKKYKYPPEGQEDALKTVISQCEMWTDNMMEYPPLLS